MEFSNQKSGRLINFTRDKKDKIKSQHTFLNGTAVLVVMEDGLSHAFYATSLPSPRTF